MNVTFPDRRPNAPDVAELFIDGSPVNYRLPPATGTHAECFADSNYQGKVRRATGREIAAYAYSALVHRRNEWADQDRIMFPTQKYLRAPKVLTIVPLKSEYRDLAGAMLVDEDLKGVGIAMQTEVPVDLAGWEVSEGGIFKRNRRVLVPYDKWYKEQWDEKNGVVIAIFEGIESASLLAKTAQGSGRSKPPLKVDPTMINSLVRRVPVLCGDYSDWLYLGCFDSGGIGNGCAPRVLN
jgi:hypothetical protein